MTSLAGFFNSKADSLAAYALLKPLLTGDNHGVSGPEPDLDAQWQLGAVVEDDLDLAAVDKVLDGFSCTRAANGKIADKIETAVAIAAARVV